MKAQPEGQDLVVVGEVEAGIARQRGLHGRYLVLASEVSTECRALRRRDQPLRGADRERSEPDNNDGEQFPHSHFPFANDDLRTCASLPVPAPGTLSHSASVSKRIGTKSSE